METIENGTRALTLLCRLSSDRLIFPGAVALALIVGACLGTA